MFGFGKLDAWQQAIDFADVVYTLTREFPSEQRLGLAGGMRAAAVSMSSAIAEGSSRNSREDFIRQLEIAAGSLGELISLSRIARNRGFLTTEEFGIIYAAADVQSLMLGILKRSLTTDS